MTEKYKFSQTPNSSHLKYKGGYQAKNNSLIEYLNLVRERMKKFDRAQIKHVPHKQNTRADILSKLTSTKKKGGNKSVIQEYLSPPSIKKPTIPLEVNVIEDNSCWMTPVFNFMTKGELPVDQKEAAITKQRACSYVVLEHKRYHRGFSIPLLKYVEESTITEILREIHEGINT